MELNEKTTVKVSTYLSLLKTKDVRHDRIFSLDFASWIAQLIQTCAFLKV